MRLNLASGALLACATLPALAGAPLTGTLADSVAEKGPTAVVVAPGHEIEYILTVLYGSDEVSSRALHPDGSIGPAATTVATGASPRAIAHSAQTGYAVVANSASDDLSVLEIGRDGQLHEVRRVASGGKSPMAVGIAFGQFAAVANRDSNILDLFELNRRGELVPVAEEPTGGMPHAIAVSRRGIVAVANSESDDLSLFHLDRYGNLIPVHPESGSLRAASDAVPVGGLPRALAFAPDGRSLFVAVQRTGMEDEIQAYEVTYAGGMGHREIEPASIALVKRSGTPAGYFATGIAATRDRLFVATVNALGQDEIREYLRDGTTLTPDATVVTPGQPASYKSLAIGAEDEPDAVNVLVTEYQSGWLRSIVFHNP
jgi:DNA-binding beta-propeller fold protein YncE